MNDTEKERSSALPENVDHTPPPEDPSQVLSPRRRSALVTYLAILFAVAFLFVAVTMAMESKRLKSINQALEDSSQKTSASLTGSINALQEENRKLSLSNGEMTEQLAALQAELEASKEKELQSAALVEQLSEDKAALELEKTQMETQYAEQLAELQKKVEDAVNVSELLQSAVAANEAGNLDALVDLLNKIAPLRELLSPSEMDLYESLSID